MFFHTYKKTSTLGVKLLQLLVVLMVLVSLIGVQPAGEVMAQTETRIALITDYGVGISDPIKSTIASLITTWAPDAVVTAGDNYHDRSPACNSYAECVAGYNNNTPGYTDFVGQGRFYPAYGNHDKWNAARTAAYRAYFNYLPGSVGGLAPLYYDVTIGNIHFWILDGNEKIADSAQETWLASNIVNSTAPWNIVIVHQPPYGTGFYGDSNGGGIFGDHTIIDYASLGVDSVIGGHNHHYERLVKDEVQYFIAGRAGNTSDSRTCSGTGSAATTEFCAGKQSPPHDSYGYMQITATETTLNFKFIDDDNNEIDSWEKTTEEPTTPSISVSPASLNFTGQPGVASEIKSYTVSGVRLQGDVTITPPSDIEISTVGGSGFNPTNPIVLNPTEGTLASTTIYARFNRATVGTSTGDISHTSLNATTRNLAVSGTATSTVESNWVAYNDLHWSSGQPNTNITQFTISSEGTSTGTLVDYLSGDLTTATVTITSSDGPGYSGGDEYDGTEASSGTDAYNTFQGIVDSTGLVFYGDEGWYVDLTFSGLTPGGSYTFATTANRNGSGTDYADRISRFTISGADAATNASTQGVNIINDHSIFFSTGANTTNGYVARWTGIDPGADGSFVVRTQAHDRNEAYAPSVFMLASEIPTDQPLITLNGSLSPFSSTVGVPSPVQSYTVTGINLTEGIQVTAPTGFEVATTMGGTYGPNIMLPVGGGTVYVRLTGVVGTFSGEISHTSSGAVTRHLGVTGNVTDQTTTPAWTAYNDTSGTSTPANTTEFTLGQTNGMLLDFDTGEQTGVTVTVNYYPPSGQTGTPYNYTSGGSMPVSGTDAHEIFNNKVNLEGVIMSATSNETDYWVDLVFNNLDPTKTYTFAATANRAGGSSYSDRETRYTISEIDSATYASSSGATKITENSVFFVTGENTNNGYVAKWVNIEPGLDGSFTVRAQPQDSQNPRSYTFGGFMLQEEMVSPPERYTVTFDANGGTTPDPESKEVVFGAAYGELATTSRTGYTFTGWFTAASGGTEVTAATVVATASDHTLYAQWTANPYTVTFDANGGTTPDPESKEVVFDAVYGDLATTSRTGYTFTGWFTAASGGTEVTAATIVATASDHTLYAQWETMMIFLPLVFR